VYVAVVALRSRERAQDPGFFAPTMGRRDVRYLYGDRGCDGATGPAFTATLRNAIDSSDEVLVSVDCSGVTFNHRSKEADASFAAHLVGGIGWHRHWIRKI
jgi:hypothetical protein